VSVIDVSRARIESAADRLARALRTQAALPDTSLARLARALREAHQANGNFNQKDEPENPIEYLRRLGVVTIFRFILSHPDMDHMDGIKALFESFEVLNFWDTDNCAEKDFSSGAGRFNEDDWRLYEALRAGRIPSTRRLALTSGDRGGFWNRLPDGQQGGDGLHVLAPTPSLVSQANQCGDFNDASYVVLYRPGNFRVLFCGDSHDKTWEHLLNVHWDSIRDVDVLIAPHHGRHSDRDYAFLRAVRPRLTLFGNAGSEHLAYEPWSARDLDVVTNNQAGNIILDVPTDDDLRVLYSNPAFAKRVNPAATYDVNLRAWHIGGLSVRAAA
jgi:competence protein ComEC